jgi:Hemerythrin HHE cation binding domain
VAFWLDRHLGFRQLMGVLRADAEGLIDANADPAAYRPRLMRLGSRLLNDLIGHHQIEDQSYFPQLAEMEPRLLRGFEMLDRDHHDLHTLIDRFASAANAALTAEGDTALRAAVAAFRGDLGHFEAMLIRHLTDEEDLVLPVVLKHRVG